MSAGTPTQFKVNNVFQYTTPVGLKHFGSHPIYTCFITISPVQSTPNYTQADQAVIASVSEAIQQSSRNGKIPVLIDVALVAPGLEGTNVVGCGDITLVNSNLGFSFALTGSDLTTERSDGTLAAFTESIALVVTYYENN